MQVQPIFLGAYRSRVTFIRVYRLKTPEQAGRCTGRPHGGVWRRGRTILIMTGPEIEPVGLSVHWFTGPTIKNRLNLWFDSFEPEN